MRAALALATLLLAAPAAAAPPEGAVEDWRLLEPDNMLVVDTTKGRIIVEMRPELAPKAVERIKLLARERVYDGLQFHRVIEGFVAQTGNPNNKDGGVSRHPDLEPEFTFKLIHRSLCMDHALRCREPSVPVPTVAARRSDGLDGLVGTIPVSGELRAEDFRGWGAYCTGVAGMGRQADPGSANSEIFFMLAPERRLDHDYTVWGRVVIGYDVLEKLARGEPPASPDVMTEVRVGSELREEMRPIVEIETGPALRRRIDAARKAKGADFSVCDVTPDARILG